MTAMAQVDRGAMSAEVARLRADNAALRHEVSACRQKLADQEDIVLSLRVELIAALALRAPPDAEPLPPAITQGEAIDRKARLARIAMAVADAHGVDLADIIGPSRLLPDSLARQAFCHVAHEDGFSHPTIARFLGRDPSTVMTAARKEAHRRAGAGGSR